MLINADLESWDGSAVVRPVRADYQRLPAFSYRDAAARLTSRQGVFYRNLIRLAEELGGGIIPVDFEQPGGRRVYLDRGCIKIAERAGFITPLVDDAHGVVSHIVLTWTA